MRKLAILALVALIGGAWFIVRDPGHIPIFDAGLQRLAETEAEGYCAGEVFWSTRGVGDEKAAQTCRAGQVNGERDLRAVQPAFCRAIENAGYSGPSCIDIMENFQYWPTYVGGITDNWSETAPYPLDLAFTTPDTDSRTGTRDGFSRDDETTTTTTEDTTTTEAAE